MTEERLKELVPDVETTHGRDYKPYDQKVVQKQTEDFRKAVKALIPFMKTKYNCACFTKSGSCKKKCPFGGKCRFLRVWKVLSDIGIPYSEIGE